MTPAHAVGALQVPAQERRGSASAAANKQDSWEHAAVPAPSRRHARRAPQRTLPNVTKNCGDNTPSRPPTRRRGGVSGAHRSTHERHTSGAAPRRGQSPTADEHPTVSSHTRPRPPRAHPYGHTLPRPTASRNPTWPAACLERKAPPRSPSIHLGAPLTPHQPAPHHPSLHHPLPPPPNTLLPPKKHTCDPFRSLPELAILSTPRTSWLYRNASSGKNVP